MPTSQLPTELIELILDSLDSNNQWFYHSTLAACCVVDHRFLPLALNRLYAHTVLAVDQKQGVELADRSKSLFITLKARPELAARVRRVDLRGGPLPTGRRRDYTTVKAVLAPSLALSSLLTLTDNIDEVQLAMRVPSFDLVAHTLLILRPTIRVLHLFMRGSTAPSASTADLLRGLTLLKELKIDGFAVALQDALHLPTFELLKLQVSIPSLAVVETPTEHTFPFLLGSLKGVSLTSLALFGPDYAQKDGHDYENTPPSSPNGETTYFGSEWDGQIGAASYLLDQLATTPASVRALEIDHIGTISDQALRHVSLLAGIPTFVNVVRLRLPDLAAKTLATFLATAPPLQWTNLEVDVTEAYTGRHLDEILEECENRSIIFSSTAPH
ncbi:hypothetical protein RQP46_008325 [Phenoliferia psychrophenolica]